MANMLLLFGFSWMVVSAIIGLLLAKRHEATVEDLGVIAARGDLAEYHRVEVEYKWKKLVHVHAFLFSVVAVCIGLALGRMNYPAAVQEGLAAALMLATVVWTLGTMRLNRPLMAIGDLAMLASIVVAAVGMFRAL